MPEKEKKPEFVVTDRRLFSNEGELRQDVVEAEERREEREREKQEAQQRANDERATQNSVAPTPAPPAEPSPEQPEMPAPTAQEQQASVAAYQESTREIDARIEQEMRKQGRQHTAKDFEVTFDKFVASLYMTSLMQLGLAAPQGAKPEVDLIGARQTIDTLAMLQQKTKGNLTPAEENMIQNCLYELRMAYLEVTNLLTHPPQGGVVGGDGRP
jgi:type IV secretory pathway VirB10-like protein